MDLQFADKCTEHFLDSMPLLTTISPWPQARVYLWDITESEQELLAMVHMTQQSLQRFGSMKSQVHRNGFLSVRALLQAADLSDDDLYYDSFGKPFLHSGQYISITHSHTRSAIIVAPYPVGIDIELRRPKILRIAHKFCPGISAELEQLVPESVDQYTYFWTTKESIYKMASMPGLGFLNDIALSEWNQDQDFTAVIPKEMDGCIKAKGKITKGTGRKFLFKGFIADQYVCGMTKDAWAND